MATLRDGVRRTDRFDDDGDYNYYYIRFDDDGEANFWSLPLDEDMDIKMYVYEDTDDGYDLLETFHNRGKSNRNVLIEGLRVKGGTKYKIKLRHYGGPVGDYYIKTKNYPTSSLNDYDYGISRIRVMGSEPFEVGEDVRFRVTVTNYESSRGPDFKVIVYDEDGRKLDYVREDALDSTNKSTYAYLDVCINEAGSNRLKFVIEPTEDGWRETDDDDNVKYETYTWEGTPKTKTDLGIYSTIYTNKKEPFNAGEEVVFTCKIKNYEENNGPAFRLKVLDRNGRELDSTIRGPIAGESYEFVDLQVTMNEIGTQELTFKIDLLDDSFKETDPNDNERSKSYTWQEAAEINPPTNIGYTVAEDGLNVTLTFTKGVGSEETRIVRADGTTITTVNDGIAYLKFSKYDTNYTIKLIGVNNSKVSEPYVIEIRTGEKPLVASPSNITHEVDGKRVVFSFVKGENTDKTIVVDNRGEVIGESTNESISIDFELYITEYSIKFIGIRYDVQSAPNNYKVSTEYPEGLRLGTIAVEVSELNKDLVFLGYVEDEEHIYGTFDNITDNAVKDLQRDNGIQPHGVICELTKSLIIAKKQEVEDRLMPFILASDFAKALNLEEYVKKTAKKLIFNVKRTIMASPSMEISLTLSMWPTISSNYVSMDLTTNGPTTTLYSSFGLSTNFNYSIHNGKINQMLSSYGFQVHKSKNTLTRLLITSATPLRTEFALESCTTVENRNIYVLIEVKTNNSILTLEKINETTREYESKYNVQEFGALTFTGFVAAAVIKAVAMGEKFVQTVKVSGFYPFFLLEEQLKYMNFDSLEI